MTVLVSHCAEEMGVQTVSLRARPHLVRWGWRRRRVGLAGSGVLGPSPGGAWRGAAPGGSSLTKTPSLGSELGPDAQPTMWMCVDWCFCANTALQLPNPDQNQLRGRGRRASVRGRDQPRLRSQQPRHVGSGRRPDEDRGAGEPRVRGSPGCGGARGGVWCRVTVSGHTTGWWSRRTVTGKDSGATSRGAVTVGLRCDTRSPRNRGGDETSALFRIRWQTRPPSGGDRPAL